MASTRAVIIPTTTSRWLILFHILCSLSFPKGTGGNGRFSSRASRTHAHQIVDRLLLHLNADLETQERQRVSIPAQERTRGPGDGGHVRNVRGARSRYSDCDKTLNTPFL